MMTKDLQLMTAEEVADQFRCSVMTVYRLVRTRKLKAYRIGRNYRFRPEEVQRYLRDSSV